jgi:hypothetical protein
VLRTTIALIVVSVAAIAGVPASEPATRKVSLYDDRVSLDLPLDWVEMTDFELEDGSFGTAQATGGRLYEIYQHGFRSTSSEIDHGLPQILVQIREIGRLPYGRFVHLPTIDDLKSDTRSSFPDGLPPLVMDVEVEAVAFDGSTFSIRLEHALSLRFRGEVRVLTRAFLTERGLVAFHYTDRERDIEGGRLFFDRLMASVAIDPEIAYRPRVTDRWPGLPFFAAAAVTAALLVLYIGYRRRIAS